MAAQMRSWTSKLAAVALGFGILAAAEAGLRLTNAGGPPSFLVTLSEHGGQRLRSVNPSYPKRYFLDRHQGQLIARGRMDAHPFLEPASPGCFRVAFVGASTVRGFPHPRSLSAAAFVEAMLADAWPGRDVQVFNLGIPALASFAVAQVLEDAMGLEPDLVVVYAGHNEYYGIDGAVDQWGPLRNRLRHALVEGRIPWMMYALRDRVLGTEVTGADLIQVLGERGSLSPGDHRRQSAPAYLGDNLSRMAGICRSAQVPVILCTLAANDAGFAPAGSESPGLPAEELSLWQGGLVLAAEALLQDAVSPEAAAEALARIEGAEALEVRSAWLQYLKGRALLELGDAGKARSAFAMARELDTMPWRAPESHNRAIRAAAGESGAVLADVAHAFAEVAPPEGVGWGLMVDHVHPSIAGQLLMARTIAAAISQVPAATVPPVDARRLRGDEEYRRLLGDVPVLRWQVDHNMAELLASPPLDRYNAHNAIRFQRLAAQGWRQLTKAEQQGVIGPTRHPVDVPLVLKVADRLFAAEDMSRARIYYAASRRQAPFAAVGDLWAAARWAQAIRRSGRDLTPVEQARLEECLARLPFVVPAPELDSSFMARVERQLKDLLGHPRQALQGLGYQPAVGDRVSLRLPKSRGEVALALGPVAEIVDRHHGAVRPLHGTGVADIVASGAVAQHDGLSPRGPFVLAQPGVNLVGCIAVSADQAQAAVVEPVEGGGIASCSRVLHGAVHQGPGESLVIGSVEVDPVAVRARILGAAAAHGDQQARWRDPQTGGHDAEALGLAADPRPQRKGAPAVVGARTEHASLPSVGLGGRQEEGAGEPIVDEVVRACFHARGAVHGETEGSLPRGTPIGGGVEERDGACVQSRLGAHEGEVGMGEVDAAGRLGQQVLCAEGFAHAQACGHMLVGGQAAASGRSARGRLRGPRDAAVPAAGLHADEGPRAIPRVKAAIGVVVAEGEADDDLVAPRPDAVVGGPAGVAPGLAVDDDVLHLRQARCS